MDVFRPEYWSRFPSPADLPNPGIEPRSPALQADSLSAEAQGKPHISTYCRVKSNLQKQLVDKDEAEVTLL